MQGLALAPPADDLRLRRSHRIQVDAWRSARLKGTWVRPRATVRGPPTCYQALQGATQDDIDYRWQGASYKATPRKDLM